MEAGLMKKS